MTTAPAVARFRALGTTAEVAVTDPARLPAAEAAVTAELAAVDDACSRFRADSEISRLHGRRGTAAPVTPLLAEALGVALRAAELTGGAVDPTVGAALEALGYDGDFEGLDRDQPGPLTPAGPVPGWWRVRLDPLRREVVVPHGIRLDLGATAKALAADRAAERAARSAGCGVLVGLGGDIAVAGQVPPRGWGIRVGDDHARTDPDRDPAIAIHGGGLATSSTTCRFWRRGGRLVHHIVDPRTGLPAAPVWRTVSVAAGTCTDANTAATAAIVLGDTAADWLTGHRLPARLVSRDGRVTTVAGWPDDEREDRPR
ncbi:FAD:protein FMN transferase [Amycolatopsis mongoliensis]|uniref:FAD:protein FMN transferase n=1 Tax=Amycolatopsis mongoliensis TaxID=715475 RepID=A0A9Y2NGA9_9PSEU|nr:FAD:protein FMN transferase [Amycolatopsis sp. 4-36]WIX98487.1 FAD:protein FMN transferase [Amycolatopsis sp. 4-36]